MTSRHQPPPARPAAELTLRGLRVFIALEETGAVALAARRIGGSPSGVSQHITALETAVGARLFDRKAKPISLTPAGQMLSAHARRILSVLSEAETDLAQFSLASLPALNLAIIDDLDASLTPVIVLGLQARYPRCFVHAFSGSSDQVIDRLAAREADLGVSALVPADTSAFRSVPILTEPFVLVCARGVIAPGEEIRAALTRLPFVQYSETVPIGQVVAAHLRRVRMDTPRRFAFEATRSVLAMVVESRGWTITTPLNILDADHVLDRIEIRPLPFPGLSRQIQLIARMGELGHLPEDLAREARAMLRAQTLPRWAALAPDLAGAIQLAED